MDFQLIRKELSEQHKRLTMLMDEFEKDKYSHLTSIEEIDNGIVFYTLISSKNAQSKAPLSEKFIARKLGFSTISASLNSGDFTDGEKYYELKNSFTNKGNNLNLRQIRLWQPVDYYICVFIDEYDVKNSKFFKLTKEQMANEVDLCGSATHGTSTANIENANVEYSITIPIFNLKNEKTKRWNENYISLELKETILGG